MSGEAPGPVGAMTREFPAWQVSLNPCGLGLAAAYWQSDDGRHRRYLVAPTPGALLALLRERATPEQRGGGAG